LDILTFVDMQLKLNLVY